MTRVAFALLAVLAASALRSAAGECPNACSGHGDCGAYDMCTCYTGYMGNDCSLRTCVYGRAHADTPLGNLDGSTDGVNVGDVTTANHQQYVAGTSEHVEIADNDSAHLYMECSNKGICNRETGECECFTAYEGSACQRASCPNACSGHGTCKTLRDLAVDVGTTYGLWDAESSMACDCDAGFTGYDCSQKVCPYGIDPLHDPAGSLDDVYNIITFYLEDGTVDTNFAGTGNVRVKFYDINGQEWITDLFTITGLNQGDLPTDFEALFTNLPNNVVPSISCDAWAETTADESISITCTFSGNPGRLKVPEFITTDEAGNSMVTDTTAYVYDLGQMGESVDYFNIDCGVSVTIAAATAEPYVTSDVTVGGADLAALKTCLGQADGNTDNNVDIENWQYGNDGTETDKPGEYPHLVKLVETGEQPVYAIMFYDSANTEFNLATPVAAGTYSVYATDGVLRRLASDSGNTFAYTSTNLAAAAFNKYSKAVEVDAAVDCVNKATNCIAKGDIIVVGMTTLFDTQADAFLTNTGVATNNNAYYAAYVEDNAAALYEVIGISTNTQGTASTITVDRPMYYGNAGDLGVEDVTTRDESLGGTDFVYAVPIYKFTPATTNIYNVVTECSGRGLCDSESGVCDCFSGYTGGACEIQSALAL